MIPKSHAIRVIDFRSNSSTSREKVKERILILFSYESYWIANCKILYILYGVWIVKRRYAQSARTILVLYHALRAALSTKYLDYYVSQYHTYKH